MVTQRSVAFVLPEDAYPSRPPPSADEIVHEDRTSVPDDEDTAEPISQLAPIPVLAKLTLDATEEIQAEILVPPSSTVTAKVDAPPPSNRRSREATLREAASALLLFVSLLALGAAGTELGGLFFP